MDLASKPQQVEVEWDIIIETIKQDKCILFIGPELFTASDGKTISDKIISYLDIGSSKDVRSYYPDDGMFLFPSEESKTRVYYKLNRFFADSSGETDLIFEKIAQIPFRLIISIVPDNRLFKAFNKLNINAKRDFYWKNRNDPSVRITPSKQAPFVYSIFGNINERDSLVLTYQDLFDYLHSILGAQSMPQDLQSIIKDTDNFIFLGVEFEKWYMQLLLRLLSSINDKDSFLRYASTWDHNAKIISFCEEQFRITFVEENIADFVNKLHQECETQQFLRTGGNGKETPLKKINALISKSNIEEAIELLNLYLDGLGDVADELLESLIITQQRYFRLHRRILSGVITEGDADVRLNQVVEDLVGIVNQARSFE